MQRQKEQWARGLEEKQRQLDLLISQKKEELVIREVAIKHQMSEAQQREEALERKATLMAE